LRFPLLHRAALLLLLLATAIGSAAQPAGKENLRQPRILLLVDASSSMLQPWSNSADRFKTAGQIVVRLMDSIYAVNPAVEFGLRVYGHQSPAQENDCFDSKLEVSFSKNNVTQMDLRLSSIHPYGVSPIAYSLKEAAVNDLADEVHNAYSIILITDGGESCGGNICEVVQQLIEHKIFFKPYILSLVDYAPLRKQYECLGSYLQVAKPGDIPAAIHNIVEAYRPMLSAPIMVSKLEAPPPPKIQITTLPPLPKRPAPGLLPQLLPAADKLFYRRPLPGVLSFTRHMNRSVVIAKPAPEPPKSEPRKHETTAAIRPAGRQLLTTPSARWPVPQRSFAHPKITLPYIAPEKEAVTTLRPESAPKAIDAHDLKTPQSIGSRNPATDIRLPEIPAEKRDTVVAVRPTPPPRDTSTRTVITIKKLPPVASTTKPVKRPPETKPAEATFTRETEDAKETSLAILFTNGRGKFYSTTPQLQLLDAVTGKVVKQFYRTVDADGNADPQVVAPGTYNLRVAGQTNLLTRHVVVEANKKNKLLVKVMNGSLRFEYYNAPGRPVSEFEALVNIRFEPGPTIRQRCTAELEYPPGNYYIEVNTMPITRFNVDIDFGATSVVYLPEPGFVQFTNTTPKGKVMLFSPLGNQFVHFTTVNITGNPASQKLRLKPGAYEAHWVKNPNLPFASETVQPFNVHSNSLTEIELH
jgi:hypothetical protein